MNLLPDQWTRSGFRHRVVARKGMVVLVERRGITQRKPHFEVAKIRVVPEKCLGGCTVMAHEAYPSSEAWGVRGWTYYTLEEAQAKYAALSKGKP